MSNSDDDKKIGYKSPPKDTQFKPGQSGNPNGRPKNTNRKPIMEDIFSELVTTKTAKGTKQIPAREGLLRVALQLATKGNLKALKMLLDIDQKHNPDNYTNKTGGDPYKEIKRLEEELKKEKQRTTGGVLPIPSYISQEEFEKEGLRLKEELRKQHAKNAEEADSHKTV